MEIVVLSKVIISLALVVFCLYAILKLVQKYSKYGTKLGNGTGSLKVSGIVYVDESTKIVSLNQRNTNYILAIGKNNLILIDKYESEE